MISLAVWIILIIYIEAVTEILVESQLFFNFRDWLSRNSSFLYKLISCGYCTSVWVAATAAWVAPGILCGIWIIDMLFKLFVLHRLSNIFHEVLTRLFKRIPLTISLHTTVTKFEGFDD